MAVLTPCQTRTRSKTRPASGPIARPDQDKTRERSKTRPESGSRVRTVRHQDQTRTKSKTRTRTRLGPGARTGPDQTRTDQKKTRPGQNVCWFQSSHPHVFSSNRECTCIHSQYKHTHRKTQTHTHQLNTVPSICVGRVLSCSWSCDLIYSVPSKLLSRQAE